MLVVESNGLSTLSLLLALGIAVLYDLRYHRIPNWLTGAVLLGGLVFNAATLSWSGFAAGLVGAAIGLVGFLPFYAKGAMGAGDVKFMAALGAFLGPLLTLQAVAWTLVSGGVYGVLIFAFAGGFRDLVGRYRGMAKTLAMTGQLVYLPPPADSPAHRKFPYCTAIATGTLIALYLEGNLHIAL